MNLNIHFHMSFEKEQVKKYVVCEYHKNYGVFAPLCLIISKTVKLHEICIQEKMFLIFSALLLEKSFSPINV
jgi:hypothetical protein